MELISVVKMRKAVQAVLMSRSYASVAWRVLVNLVQKTHSQYHPLLQKRKIKKTVLVLITANRGLCSNFNERIIAKASDFLEKHREQEIEVVLVGTKGRKAAWRWEKKILADFPKPDIVSSMEEIISLSYFLIERYRTKKTDQVVLAYTDFFSPLKQIPRLRRILPIEKEDEMLGVIKEKPREEISELDYLFEPSVKEVLKFLLPRLIEVQIYQAILESNASEHASRMMAMRNATKSAEDLISELTLYYHQIRQTIITKELTEISTGRLALEK